MPDQYTEFLNTPDDPLEPDDVRRARKLLGMTQTDLADAVGSGIRQHITRAEADQGLRGCQAKALRYLLKTKGLLDELNKHP